MPSPIEYRGFAKLYDGPVRKLITPASVLPTSLTGTAVPGVPIKTLALWDTGATRSCIKPELKDSLKSYISWTGSPTTFAGIGGKVRANFTLVSLFIANNFELEGCPVYVLDFPGNAGILIGMDIIAMGDFAVCNTNGETSFSFAMPPFPDRINLADKADAINRQNNKT
jgi:hypothetical protein